eukprot:c4514_g1_i1.p6 GENE.c4514_g1_i1~~c4514_g1_i1.p6  ORF type:complete len:128 (+),score=20.15 c4514_g1_i1:296-679(+)
MQTSNTVVEISEVGGRPLSADGGPADRLLRWVFAKTKGDVATSHSYVMQVARIGSTRDSSMDWELSGVRCSGRFVAKNLTAACNSLLPTSTISTTYRVQDANTIAVCVVEVDERAEPKLQYGLMVRQ